MMNEKCQELELTDTHFTNPHGLDDEDHFTTAKDLAKVGAELMENSILKEKQKGRNQDINVKDMSNYSNIKKQLAEKEKKLEERKLDKNTDYMLIKGLRTEAAQKLNEIKPLTIGEASRISCVNPADITILIMNFSKK